MFGLDRNIIIAALITAGIPSMVTYFSVSSIEKTIQQTDSRYKALQLYSQLTPNVTVRVEGGDFRFLTTGSVNDAEQLQYLMDEFQPIWNNDDLGIHEKLTAFEEVSGEKGLNLSHQS
ncbi:hypothetical protein ACQKPX_10640 [Photobacterium sp. DNB23_23_1]